MAKLSVVISAYNEEQKIERCLKSVTFADEIILVNSSSTDKTVAIARKYTKKIFNRPNHPMLNINKNFGFTKASGDWILNLDADEKITPELEKEIKSILTGEEILSGFWVPRKNIIFGKWMQYTGWYPDYQLRLFRRKKGKFPEKHVHEHIEIDGGIGYLDTPIEHLNYESVSQFLRKHTTIYSDNEVENLLKGGYKFQWKDAMWFPAKEFLSRFFARKGYRDGFHGLMLSMLLAFYHFIIFTKIWEKEQYKEYEEDMLTFVSKEFTQISKDSTYWLANEKLKETRGLVQSLSLRIKRKMRNI